MIRRIRFFVVATWYWFVDLFDLLVPLSRWKDQDEWDWDDSDPEGWTLPKER